MSRPHGVGHLDDPRTGLIVPTALDASPTATTRVRGPIARSRSRQVQGAVVLADPDPADRDAALFLEGEPRGDVGVVVQPRDDDLVAGFSVRPIARLTAKVRVVMFWPNTTSSGPPAPRKSAAATWASARIASLSSLVAKAPSWLAFDRSR
jgi:hypothetical protein